VVGNISASSFTGSLFGTSSWSSNSLTASYASGSKVFAISSSYTLSSSYALSSSYGLSSSYSLTSTSASYAPLVTGATYTITASWAQSASNAINSQTASYYGGNILNSQLPSQINVTGVTASFTGSHIGSLTGTASWSNNSLTASYITASNIVGTVTSASYSLSSSYSLNSTSASYALSSSYSLNSTSASYLVPANSYNITNLTASGNISSSGTITALTLVETSTVAAKSNILSLPYQLDKVMQLNPVSFTYKVNNEDSIGLIAEEVGQIYPEFTTQNHDAISYGKITSVLIQSIKDLKQIIDNQQIEIDKLKNK